MKKILIYTAFALASVFLIYLEYASANADNSRIPRVNRDGQLTFKHWQLVKHTFRFHLPQNSKPLSQIIIIIPSTIAVSNDIDVLEQNNKKITINISVNSESNIIIAFPEPVAPNTKFNIILNKVKQPILGPTSVYQFSAKFIGSDAEIPVGVTQFRTN